ncbi:uncharacterized protein LOC124915689 [Impatiens glandulifera]|uniref:uncharacterized protein LOC124915689 n=1 Tax=Impatiens glandulifera TaxID=253017 RepID=UPI001FB13E92|nr:uncharacterized protein LOC124915689 [Impatiens glandulifera]
MAVSARAFLISRFAAVDHSINLLQSPPPPTPTKNLPFTNNHLLIRPILLPSALRKRSGAAVNCLFSGVDGGGGGVSDDFVSTRKSGFSREFSVIANMLKRIEPLDTSVISKGVSDSAKDSMKETISAMLGLLPSDQFSVIVRVSKAPLDRLLVSSILTGYTLWNAEYRISLMRNFEIDSEGEEKISKVESFGSLSPEVRNYIQQLESELTMANKEMDSKKQANVKNHNDLLGYLRSLESYMVSELSQPSSLEVEKIIHQLVQNILLQFFKEEESNGESISSTSRDYLAKLLFWCMLMGHHLRGLENRLHLSCAVGLL